MDKNANFFMSARIVYLRPQTGRGGGKQKTCMGFFDILRTIVDFMPFPFISAAVIGSTWDNFARDTLSTYYISESGKIFAALKRRSQ
ncbi:MAG: hypothetical protein RR501_02020 [Cloacibacillus sp.]